MLKDACSHDICSSCVYLYYVLHVLHVACRRVHVHKKFIMKDNWQHCHQAASGQGRLTSLCVRSVCYSVSFRAMKFATRQHFTTGYRTLLWGFWGGPFHFAFKNFEALSFWPGHMPTFLSFDPSRAERHIFTGNTDFEIFSYMYRFASLESNLLLFVIFWIFYHTKKRC